MFKYITFLTVYCEFFCFGIKKRSKKTLDRNRITSLIEDWRNSRQKSKFVYIGNKESAAVPMNDSDIIAKTGHLKLQSDRVIHKLLKIRKTQSEFETFSNLNYVLFFFKKQLPKIITF